MRAAVEDWLGIDTRPNLTASPRSSYSTGIPSETIQIGRATGSTLDEEAAWLTR